MDDRKEDQVLKGWRIMWWREMKELAGMALLLGVRMTTGLGISTAAGAAELAEVREMPSIEQPMGAEMFQALGSIEPVGSPDCA